MKLLVFGKSGQVATELASECPHDAVVTFLDRQAADLSNPEQCRAAVLGSDADAVVNAAAYTAVDPAETDETLATVINADAPAAMATACAAMDIPFLHLSTDYVFDGQGEIPFTPDQPAGPLNAYGRSKLAGEQAVRASGARYVILRTSWVFSAHGRNFVTTMQKLGQDRDMLNVVADQIGGPTPAKNIAQSLFKIANTMGGGHHGGTYHYCGAPYVSWADFARAIMAEAKLDCEIRDITTDAFPTPAQRPLNSRLNSDTLLQDFRIAPPDWRLALHEICAAKTGHS